MNQEFDYLIIPFIENEEQLNKALSQDDATIIVTKKNCPFCEKALPFFVSEALSNIPIEDITDIYELNYNDSTKYWLDSFLEKYDIVVFPTLIKVVNGEIKSIREGAELDDFNSLQINPVKTLELYIKYLRRWV